MWSDLVQPKEALVSLAGAAVQSVEDLEADVDSAEFAAIRTKIAMLWLNLKTCDNQTKCQCKQNIAECLVDFERISKTQEGFNRVVQVPSTKDKENFHAPRA